MQNFFFLQNHGKLNLLSFSRREREQDVFTSTTALREESCMERKNLPLTDKIN